MDRNVLTVIYLIAMVVIIVLVDVFIFRHHVIERLLSNIGIVLIFIAFFFRYIKK